ncbi:L,D-transpeptidase family protein [Evansella tamaricis]|uniref:L,D-transpeptidase family protein n=1 Tax=Evansella tamaricis TaxID=2069301 RepID=A0ABS6JL92_9BACI|nr:L,D-transpeptidase family protein [Evansella tamaricis]MBU9713195.1 L,D-transpeptidase family protein [Evansella tamaricis]
MRKFVLSALILILLFSLFPISTAASGGQLIIIKKSTNELAFYENSELVKVFRVATGKSSELTPEGNFMIVNKIKNRPYYKEDIPGGDPSNPLGKRWLGLNARGTWGTTYAIHGNNNPNSIGTYASLGCVRMHNGEIEWLFDRVRENTPVIITSSNESFKNIAKSNGYSVSGDETAKSAPQKKLDCDSVLQQGCNKEEVKKIQRQLVELGYITSGVDGMFGPDTKKAVKSFQKDNKLTADGVVGPKTAEVLEAKMNEEFERRKGDREKLPTSPDEKEIPQETQKEQKEPKEDESSTGKKEEKIETKPVSEYMRADGRRPIAVDDPFLPDWDNSIQPNRLAKLIESPTSVGKSQLAASKNPEKQLAEPATSSGFLFSLTTWLDMVWTNTKTAFNNFYSEEELTLVKVVSHMRK